MTDCKLTRKQYPHLPLFLCFAVPFAVACIAYAILGLYPFGDQQLLAHDEWHQYYPFFVSFREKLLSGGSLQYTWDVGMGTGYASLFAYYLASPLYLISVLVPEGLLREYFALMSAVKLASAGLFFGIFLRTAFRKNDYALPFFALMYAFCTWSGGYAWNIIWLDSFALLPMLIAGTVSLLREGRFRMYVLGLAFTLWCNYYIAYFCCIFVFLCFVGYSLLCWKGFKNFCLRFLRIGLCTLLAFGLAAVLILPTVMAMGNTYSAKGGVVRLLALNIEKSTGVVGADGLWTYLTTETLPKLVSAVRQTLTAMMTGVRPNKFDGNLPNIFSSLTAVVLVVYGLFNKKIKLREKLFSLFLLGFFLLSFIFRVLDYFLHGFHFPNMLNYRFSFLFSFVLIVAAYHSYRQLRYANKWALVPVALVCAALLLNYYTIAEELSETVLLASAAVLLAVPVLLLLHGKRRMLRRVAVIGLFAVISCEMILCFGLSVALTGSSSRSAYPKEGKHVQQVLDELEDEELFYRTEMTTTQTLNDGALNGYHGVSIFSSSTNVNFNRFSRILGLSAWPASNRYVYYEGMPFTNAFCGIKYLIDRDGRQYNIDYNTPVSRKGDVLLMENEAYLGLGFMTASPLKEFQVNNISDDVVQEQNKMFALATGIEAPLYEEVPCEAYEASEGCTMELSGENYHCSTKNVEEEGSFRFTFTAPIAGLYGATSSTAAGASEVDFYCNGIFQFSRNIKARSLFTLGNLQAGDEIELVYEVEEDKDAYLNMEVIYMDREVFETGLALLKDETWKLTEFSDTCLCGEIEVLEDGLFYAAIPYEPGWRAFVDGKEVPLAESYDPAESDVKLTDSVISFPLSKGSHTIELRYRSPGLLTGGIISGISLLLFALLVFLLRKKPLLLPDAPALEEYAFVPQEISEEELWAQEVSREEAEEAACTAYPFEEILEEYGDAGLQEEQPFSGENLQELPPEEEPATDPEEKIE